MNISELMTKKPTILEENATVLDAIKKMKAVGCGMLPIGDIKHIKGVVTDRDIMMRAVTMHKDLSSIPIKEIMSKKIIFCYEDEALQKIVQQMNQHNIRRVLIKNKDHHLSGIISLGDIVRRIQDKTLLASLFTKTMVG